MKKQILVCLAGLGLVWSTSNRVLAEPALGSVTIGSQSPLMVAPGGAATYTLAIIKGNAGNPNAYLGCIGLPEGATASFSSRPIYAGGQTAALVTLTITTTESLPSGTYPFVIVAQHGHSPHVATASGILTVGEATPAIVVLPTITSLVMLPDGTAELLGTGGPNEVYVIQATTDLFSSSWTNIGTVQADASGSFSFIDTQAANYSARFYQVVVP